MSAAAHARFPRPAPSSNARSLSRRSLLGLLGASGLALAGCGVAAPGNAEHTLVAAHASSTDHFMHRSFVRFKEHLEEISEGRIEVKIFPNGVFGGDRELTEAIQLDNLQLTAPSSSPLAAFSPSMNIWDLPYLFDSREHAYAVLDGPLGTRIMDDLGDVRLKGLGYWENGFRNLTADREDITGPSDMRGIKLRTLENPTQIRAWNATGASATPMAFTEVYTGLQQGTIDAQENPLPLIVTQKFYEVQTALVLSRHVYTPSPLILSRKFYDGLPDELQRMVEEAGTESVRYCREQSVVDDEAALGVIEDAGLTVTELSAAQREEFGTVMTEAAEPFVRRLLGDRLVDELRAEVEEAR
ncbi:TRAP transporter substrate-binding protein [Brevibacterium album]|uniref:TRAP transporter substrate-binding protein n=1 Tax=Brevibacterium album TaxID=417948 RepID=UPI0004066372|nr:TRAP transporter substrate-binding protein [Brevibacterium album]